jgi:carbon monoxide dehydrogenase subunit G
MLNIESKSGLAKGSQETVYNFISDFRNFNRLLPSEHLRNLEITGDTIRFNLDGLGPVGLKIAERTPSSQLVITGTENSSASFTFWFNIRAVSDSQSEVNLILQANLNMFLEMMARGPLQQFVDLMIDKLTAWEFEGTMGQTSR